MKELWGGLHWFWHPDGEHLLGYGPDPEQESRMCLAQVKYDGTDYRRISRHASGGHPSISPAHHTLLATDDYGRPGRVELIDLEEDRVIRSFDLPRVHGNTKPKGRNRFRVCHHPVFSADGSRLLVNLLPGGICSCSGIVGRGGVEMSLWTFLEGGHSIPGWQTAGRRWSAAAGYWLANRSKQAHIHPSCLISPQAKVCPRNRSGS